MITTPLFRISYCRSVLAAVAGLAAVSVDAQSLLSHYTLDGTGADSGSYNKTGTLAGSAVFGSSGSGVGNFDKALSSPGTAADYFTAPTGASGEFALAAITIALWVKIDSASTSQIERLVSNITASTGFDFAISKATLGTGGAADLFEFSFGFNSTSGRVISADNQYVSDKWLFLAVTYDSANSTNNVKFYSGSETAGVVLNDTLTSVGSGSIASSASALEIGGTPASTGDRNPVALFNDVRIYDGALTSVQLEALRAGALIPEPSQYAMIFGLLSLAGIVVRRGARR